MPIAQDLQSKLLSLIGEPPYDTFARPAPGGQSRVVVAPEDRYVKQSRVELQMQPHPLHTTLDTLVARGLVESHRTHHTLIRLTAEGRQLLKERGERGARGAGAGDDEPRRAEPLPTREDSAAHAALQYARSVAKLKDRSAYTRTQLQAACETLGCGAVYGLTVPQANAWLDSWARGDRDQRRGFVAEPEPELELEPAEGGEA